YSGSPLAIGFGEANQKKSICQVDIENGAVTVKLIEVPVWQKLESIKGNWNEIENRIGELVAIDSSAWLEIIYQGDEIISDLQERVVASVEDSKLEILRIKNTRLIDRVLEQSGIEETLDDLDENEVFERCLASHEVPQDQRRELLSTYQELLVSYCEKDRQKE
ncbi:MAG: exonuclease SbcCD subunit D C-terminal domain-containing protein, partial [Candidatus Cloacimonetes bacterium]|nr:exonuclease SbcCD subunit D C-terminal domain-containing protein [Candidatus Cloacimonadota bacterium]